MKSICIIPARSGSKGLKNKNVKLFCGKPLIAYAIEEALKANVFDVVMVSTDSTEYAKIARKYGAEVPFLRSEKTSSDKASSWEAVKEVVENYKNKGIHFDSICLLQPTSPLREADDIVAAYKDFLLKDANFVVGVCEVDHSPLWCNVLPEDLSLSNFINKAYANMPRQSLKQYYRINGAIYIIKQEYLMKTEEKNLMDNKAYAFIMNKSKSIDIDDEFDFIQAESIYKAIKKEC